MIPIGSSLITAAALMAHQIYDSALVPLASVINQSQVANDNKQHKLNADCYSYVAQTIFYSYRYTLYLVTY